MTNESQQVPQVDEPVHLSFTEQRQPLLHGNWRHNLVARGDQLAFAAEVVRFGFAPDDFALDVDRLPGKRSGRRSTALRFAVKVENLRTRHKVTYYGGPGRAWVAEFLADLIAGEFGQP
jgi:hypothetical protein